MLTEAGARTLTAQFMHETGGGKYCFNWNLGNVKAGPNDKHMYLRNVWELFSPDAAQSQVSGSGGLATIATEEEAKKHGWGCPPGKVVVVFQPPHPQCRFKAYDTLEEGAQKWLDHMKSIAKKDEELVTALNAGDTASVARVLKKHGYYSGAEKDYAASMAKAKKEIDKEMGPE